MPIALNAKCPACQYLRPMPLDVVQLHLNIIILIQNTEH